MSDTTSEPDPAISESCAAYALGGGGCAPDPAACYDESVQSGAPPASDLTESGVESLPFTGGTNGPLALAGASCVILGLTLVATRRRRNALER